MLTSSKQMIFDAQKGGYAIGCFNTSDLEITKAIIAAAAVQKSPVIVATSERAIAYGGLESLAALIKEEAEKTEIPVALHLDHGKSLKIVEICLEAGYTSVMIDGSELSLAANTALTYQAVVMAHTKDIPCEGELGFLGRAGSSEGNLTNPDDVSEFVKKTDVDFLAVSIGSAHGIGKQEKLKIEVLKKIRLQTHAPLVLHGGSGVADRDIKKAINSGIAKVNIDTDIRNEFTKELREILEKYPREEDFRAILGKVMVKIQELVERKIKLFGSVGKAG